MKKGACPVKYPGNSALQGAYRKGFESGPTATNPYQRTAAKGGFRPAFRNAWEDGRRDRHGRASEVGAD